MDEYPPFFFVCMSSISENILLMKRIFAPLSAATLLSVLILLASCRDRTSSSTRHRLPSAGICFADTVHDFGIIPLSQPIDSFDFVFRNTGQGMLVVLDVKTSCHCTKAVFPQSPIAPGQQAYIRVFYDGHGRSPEYFNKSVKVYTNARARYMVLNIKGELQ